MSMPKRNSRAIPFWCWSNWKDIGTAAESRRTCIKLLMNPKPYVALDRLSYGHGPVAGAEIPLLEGDLQFLSTAEDCPWPVTSMFSVSDRVRKIIEAKAPMNCQFFPLKLWHAGRPCDLTYWALYAESVDCAHQGKSGRTVGGDIWDPVIVEDR